MLRLGKYFSMETHTIFFIIAVHSYRYIWSNNATKLIICVKILDKILFVLLKFMKLIILKVCLI